jgi:hypothetical protein
VKWPLALDSVKLSVDKSSARAAVTRGLERMKLRISTELNLLPGKS